MAANPPIPPDPDRIWIPPHAAMAMLSPPPCYSETTPPARPSHRRNLELPPPYWAENAYHPTDMDRLIPGGRLDPQASERAETEDRVASCPQVFSPRSELPVYSSHDDLPTYDAATAEPEASQEPDSGNRAQNGNAANQNAKNGDAATQNRADPIHEDVMAQNGENESIMAQLQQREQPTIHMYSEMKDDQETPQTETNTNQPVDSGAAVPV